MSRMCEVCGKKPMFGHNVSHANNKTQKIQNPNVQKVKVRESDGRVHSIFICTRCIRTGKVVKA